MTNLKKCAEDNFKVIYPYIKQMCFNEHQEEWLLNFYYLQILPYAKEMIEKDFIAGQNIKSPLLQFFYIKRLFDFEHKVSNELSDEALCLHNQLNDMSPLLHKFQDAYFSNVWQRKEGFSPQSFYSDQYVVNIRQLLELSVLFWMLVNLEDALQVEPSNDALQDYQKWVTRRLVIHSNNTTTFYSQMILEPYKPNVLWYFLHGAERFFIFFQMERIRFKLIRDNTQRSLHGFLNDKLNAQKVLIDFPVAAISFSLNILFLILLPYRFLRTLTNEVYSRVKNPITRLIEKFNPRYKQDTGSHLLYLSLLGLIYGSLLTLFSLPLIPLPLTWVPHILLSPVAAIIPLSYLFLVPCIAIVKKIYYRYRTVESPDDSIAVEEQTTKDETLNVNAESDLSLLHRYKTQLRLNRAAFVNTSTTEKSIEEEDVIQLLSQRFS
tara:strand:- start:34150 stop:35454 length:1305 start_codon:yes stop_codon:yes gene_type:complete